MYFIRNYKKLFLLGVKSELFGGSNDEPLKPENVTDAFSDGSRIDDLFKAISKDKKINGKDKALVEELRNEVGKIIQLSKDGIKYLKIGVFKTKLDNMLNSGYTIEDEDGYDTLNILLEIGGYKALPDSVKETYLTSDNKKARKKLSIVLDKDDNNKMKIYLAGKYEGYVDSSGVYNFDSYGTERGDNVANNNKIRFSGKEIQDVAKEVEILEKKAGKFGLIKGCDSTRGLLAIEDLMRIKNSLSSENLNFDDFRTEYNEKLKEIIKKMFSNCKTIDDLEIEKTKLEEKGILYNEFKKIYEVWESKIKNTIRMKTGSVLESILRSGTIEKLKEVKIFIESSELLKFRENLKRVYNKKLTDLKNKLEYTEAELKGKFGEAKGFYTHYTKATEAEMTKIQNALNDKGYSVTVTGVFDLETSTAIVKLQAKEAKIRNLTDEKKEKFVDAKAGTTTLGLLGINKKTKEFYSHLGNKTQQKEVPVPVDSREGGKGVGEGLSEKITEGIEGCKTMDELRTFSNKYIVEITEQNKKAFFDKALEAQKNKIVKGMFEKEEKYYRSLPEDKMKKIQKEFGATKTGNFDFQTLEKIVIYQISEDALIIDGRIDEDTLKKFGLIGSNQTAKDFYNDNITSGEGLELISEISDDIDHSKLSHALDHLEEGRAKSGNSASFDVGTVTYTKGDIKSKYDVQVKLFMGKVYVEIDGYSDKKVGRYKDGNGKKLLSTSDILVKIDKLKVEVSEQIRESEREKEEERTLEKEREDSKRIKKQIEEMRFSAGELFGSLNLATTEGKNRYEWLEKFSDKDTLDGLTLSDIKVDVSAGTVKFSFNDSGPNEKYNKNLEVEDCIKDGKLDVGKFKEGLAKAAKKAVQDMVNPPKEERVEKKKKVEKGETAEEKERRISREIENTIKKMEFEAVDLLGPLDSTNGAELKWLQEFKRDSKIKLSDVEVVDFSKGNVRISFKDVWPTEEYNKGFIIEDCMIDDGAGGKKLSETVFKKGLKKAAKEAIKGMLAPERKEKIEKQLSKERFPTDVLFGKDSFTRDETSWLLEFSGKDIDPKDKKYSGGIKLDNVKVKEISNGKVTINFSFDDNTFTWGNKEYNRNLEVKCNMGENGIDMEDFKKGLKEAAAEAVRKRVVKKDEV